MTRFTSRRAAAFVMLLVAAACGSPAEKYDAKAPPVPFVSQLHPNGADPATYDGTMNCGPAVMTGIAKAHRLTDGYTDAEVIETLAEVAGTSETGTTGNGMIAALEWMGFETAASKGCDWDFIDDELAAGHDVIAIGDYYALPGHDDPTKTSGHYIAVTAARGNWTSYDIMDPLGPTLHSVSDEQLQDFIESAPEGGFTISAW